MLQHELPLYLVSSVLLYSVAAHSLAAKILPEHTAIFAVSAGAALSWWLHSLAFGKEKRNEDRPGEATSAHFVCSGLLLGFSRFFEFASLARIHPITHEAVWVLIPVFYIAASETWKELRFEYRRTPATLGALFAAGVALIFVALMNQVRERFGILYAFAWIATKAYYVIYAHYIRIALGADPGKIHLWSNIVAAVFAAALGVADCKRMALSFSALAWLISLFAASMLYGVFYHHYDSTDLRVNAAQKVSYRCQIRMLFFGVVGAIFWPIVREYNYAAFAASWVCAMSYKYLHMGQGEESVAISDESIDLLTMLAKGEEIEEEETTKGEEV